MANIRNAGRPSRTITLNFNRVDDTVTEVLSLCANEDTREIILSFCNEVRNRLVNPRENFVNKRCQTRHITADQIIDFLPNLPNNDLVYVATNIIHNLDDKVEKINSILNTLTPEDKQSFHANYLNSSGLFNAQNLIEILDDFQFDD